MEYSKYVILEDRCRCCGACIEKCPDAAIVRTEKGFFEIEEGLCICCGKCLEACQVNAIKKKFSLSVLFRNFGDSNLKGREEK